MSKIRTMNQEYLKTITKTISGLEVKNLRWLKVDNIITGLVKDPVCGKETLHDGYVSGAWRKNGQPTNKIKNRPDLALPIDLTKII